MKSWRTICIWGVAALLAACGGGGGGGGGGVDGGGTVTQNTAPVARAGPALAVTTGATMPLDGRRSSDADGDALSYSWRIASAPPGSSTELSAPNSATPQITPDKDGTYRIALVVSDGMARSSESFVTITAAPSQAQITIDQPEPISGEVTLSLTGPLSGPITWGSPIDWYLDGQLLRTGPTDRPSAVTWDASTASNESHLVIARVRISQTQVEEVRRRITVSNTNVIRLSLFKGSVRTGPAVKAQASSPYGIMSVSATLDGSSLGTLTQPNGCDVAVCDGHLLDRWVFPINARSVGSGTHTAVVTATDGSGATHQRFLTVVVSNAPLLFITTPQDGAILTDTLTLAGTTSTDKGDSVTVKVYASIDYQQIFSGSGPAFSASYAVGGLAPGPYTLRVTAADGEGEATSRYRNVVVAAATTTPASLAFTLDEDSRLVAADGGKVLYAAADGSMVLRDLTSGAEAVLSGAASLQNASSWQLSNGRVYAHGKGVDCTLRTCIYQWLADGTRSNLSAADPANVSIPARGDMNPVAKDGYVLWGHDRYPDSNYSLYHVASGSYTLIEVPGEVNTGYYDFAVVNGVVHFWFRDRVYDIIFHWRSDTGVTTNVANGFGPRTDGTRAAWRGNGGLMAQATPAATPEQIASSSVIGPYTGGGFLLADGLLAWVEANGSNGGRALKANVGGTTSTLSLLSSVVLRATRSGQVVYLEGGKLFSWNAATGATVRRFDAEPQEVLMTGDALVFRYYRSVYRIAL